MQKSRVALVRCESYDLSAVREAVAQGLDLLGGCRSFVRPGEKLLLKPNLLAAVPPEKCVTAHPAVFQAVAEAFLAAGAVLSYGDSPALDDPLRAARRAGLLEIGNQLGLEFADFQRGQVVSFPQGIQNKRFTIAAGVLASDGLISLPKLKTHDYTIITGAIKNQFGCIPGLNKSELHLKLPDIDSFSRMLVDLNRYLSPRLFVMDGIIGMEGNGPRNGRPKKLGALLFSSDPVALDATACRLIGLNPESVPVLRQGHAMGLGALRSEDISILGEQPASFKAGVFAIGHRPPILKFNQPWLRSWLVPRPRINPDRCLKCGICSRMCPVRPAAVVREKEDEASLPTYDYDRCIRCFCCQEVCPEGAVEVETPLLAQACRWLLMR